MSLMLAILITIGDSKTGYPSNTWPKTLAASISTSTGNQCSWSALGYSAGATLAQAAAGAPSLLDTETLIYGRTLILVNLGTHDLIFGLPSEAQFTANYLAVIDTVRARYPTAQFYLTRPWYTGKDADSDTMAGWIGAVIAARSTFVFAGDDERAWFKPNVATYSTDSVHFYTEAGQAAAAQAKLAALP